MTDKWRPSDTPPDESRWVLIKPYLLGLKDALSPEAMDMLEKKFRAGEFAHDGEQWMDWPPERFAYEIQNEICDMVLYCAMAKFAIAMQEDDDETKDAA